MLLGLFPPLSQFILHLRGASRPFILQVITDRGFSILHLILQYITLLYYTSYYTSRRMGLGRKKDLGPRTPISPPPGVIWEV